MTLVTLFIGGNDLCWYCYDRVSCTVTALHRKLCPRVQLSYDITVQKRTEQWSRIIKPCEALCPNWFMVWEWDESGRGFLSMSTFCHFSSLLLQPLSEWNKNNQRPCFVVLVNNMSQPRFSSLSPFSLCFFPPFPLYFSFFLCLTTCPSLYHHFQRSIRATGL